MLGILQAPKNHILTASLSISQDNVMLLQPKGNYASESQQGGTQDDYVSFCWIGSTLTDRQCAKLARCQPDQVLAMADLLVAKPRYYSEVMA